MKRIALIFAVLYSIFVTGVVLHLLVGTLGPNEQISHFQVVVHLSTCATAAILAGATGQAFALLLGVAIIRGPQAIGWVRPSECQDLFAWLSYEWRFFGAGGQQEGVRFCGLEMAIHGTR